MDQSLEPNVGKSLPCQTGSDHDPSSTGLGVDAKGWGWGRGRCVVILFHCNLSPLETSRTSSDAFRALNMGLHKFPLIKNKWRWMVLVSSQKRQWRKAMTRTKISHYPSGQDWKFPMEVWLFCEGIPKLIPYVAERFLEKKCMFYLFFFLSSFYFNDLGKWEECKWVNALFDLCCSWA